MKQAWKAAWRGICDSAIIYLACSFVLGLSYGHECFSSGYGMARSVGAVVLIGLGFGLPSVIYKTELPTGLKVAVHMGIGCLVMAAASWIAGWLRLEQGLWPVLGLLGVQIVCAFLVWLAYYLRTRQLAKKMNKQIREKQHKE